MDGRNTLEGIPYIEIKNFIAEKVDFTASGHDLREQTPYYRDAFPFLAGHPYDIISLKIVDEIASNFNS